MMWTLIITVGLIIGIWSLRILWQVKPNTNSCALFWGCLIALSIVAGNYYLLVGMGLNALVTTANGGYMPVSDKYDNDCFSVWKRSTNSTRWKFLGDNYKIGPIIISVGDMCLVGALLIPLVYSLLSATT